MTRPPPPTDEQLRLAWRQISRPGWPPTLDAALQRHPYRVALLAMARNLGRVGLDRRPAQSAHQAHPARAAEPDLFATVTEDPAP